MPPIASPLLRYMLRGAQARPAAIVRYSCDAIVGKTLENVIASWNAAATRMFGHEGRGGGGLLYHRGQPRRCEMLQTMPELWHHDVREASDGVRGLEIAKDCHPDVVLITVELPRVEGYEVARRLLSTEPRGRRLVVLEDTPRARKAGFGAHLVRRIAHPDRLAPMLAARPRKLDLSP